MSFGGSQGTVRYAVMLTDQVTVPAQKISNEFRNMGTQMTTLAQKTNVFNNAIMSNNRTFTASLTPIKNTGNALNQLGIQQKTIGSQLASIGSGFKNNALAIGAAASSVLGLYQNYSNLSSAQNNANKAATASKAANNNLAKAQDNLAKTISKYGANSKEAKAAQDKLTVAQERATNKAESAKIAQDNLNQTMADFGINVLPNVVLAGGSIVSIFDNINLKGKSLGGVVSKIGGLFSGLVGSLTGASGGFKGLDTSFRAVKSSAGGMGSSISSVVGSLTGLGSNSKTTSIGIDSIGKSATGSVGGLTSLKGGLMSLKGGFTSIGSAITGTVIPALTNLTGGKGLGGLMDKLKGASTSATGFWGSITGTAVVGGLSIAGAALIIQQVQQIQDAFDAAGIKFTKMKQGMLFSPEDAQKSFEEWDELMHATGMSIAAMGNDMDLTKQKFVAAGGKLDAVGNIIFGSYTKAKEAAKAATVETDKLAAAEKKLSDDQAKLASLQKERQTTGVKAEEEHMKAVIASDKAEVARLKTQAETAKAMDKTTGAIKSQTHSIDEMSSTFATITKTVPALGKNFKDVGDNIAYVTYQTDPFNAGVAKANLNLDDTAKKAAALKGTFATMTKYVGNVGKDFVALGKGMVLVTHQTDPFNMSLSQMNIELPKADKFLTGFGDTVGNLAKQFAPVNTVVLKAKSTILGLGDTVDNLIKKFQTLKTTKIVFPSFPSAAQNLTQQEPGPFGGNPAAKDTTKIQNDLAAATKKTTEIMEADKIVVRDRTKAYLDLVKQLQGAYDTTGKTMDQLKGYSAQQDSINKQITSFQQDQEVGYKEVEASILGVAFAHNVNTEKMKDMVLNGKDEVAELRNMVAEAINYTAALDDTKTNQELLSQGFLSAITNAEGFFNGLVEGTESQNVFNASVAEGAYELGINSEMLAFSSSKMQDLVKTTYEMQQGFSDISVAAATDTSFLRDNVLQQAVLKNAMIAGAQAANDWTINMISSVQQGKDFHGQLLQLTADMIGLPVPLSLTNDQLQEVMTNFKETGDAAGSLADVVTQNLAPAFDLVTGLLDAKSFKDFGKALKDLALPKGFLNAGKDLDDAMKPMFNAAKTAEKAGNAIKLLTTVDLKEGDFSKKLKTVKSALEGLQKVPGTTPAIDNILKQAEHMSRTDFIKHAGSLNMVFDAIKQFGFLPDDIASAALELFRKETAKTGPSATTAAAGIDKLTGSMSTFIGKMQGLDQKTIDDLAHGLSLWTGGGDKDTPPTTQKTTVTLDTGPANAALSALIKRIDSISNMHPAPQLNQKPAQTAISQIIKRIDSISNMKPAPQINQKPAQNAISQIIKRIDSINKMKPAFQINQKPAQTAISQVINRIDSINNMHPKVNVSVGVTGPGVKFLAEGMHGVVTKPTLFIAGEAGPERVDVSRTSGTGAGMEIDRNIAVKPTATVSRSESVVGGSGMTGNLIVNNVIDLGSDRFVRSFKRKLGNNRYTLGG